MYLIPIQNAPAVPICVSAGAFIFKNTCLFKKCLYLCTPAKNARSCIQVRAMPLSLIAEDNAVPPQMAMQLMFN